MDRQLWPIQNDCSLHLTLLDVKGLLRLYYIMVIYILAIYKNLLC
jgi:hypothetical protein